MRFNIVSVPLMMLLLGLIVYIDISAKTLKKLNYYRRSGIRTKGRVIDKSFDAKLKTAKVKIEYPCEGIYCQGINDDIVSYSIEEAIMQFENDQYYDVIVYPDDHEKFIREVDIPRIKKHFFLAIPICIVLSAGILYVSIIGIRLPLDFL